MLISMQPGEINGSQLAVKNELNALYDHHQITRVKTDGQDSDLSRLARAWAKQKGIPITTLGRPDMVICALDFQDTFGRNGASTAEPKDIITQSSTVWKDELKRSKAQSDQIAGRNLPARLQAAVQTVKDIFKTQQVLLINTTQQDYVREN